MKTAKEKYHMRASTAPSKTGVKWCRYTKRTAIFIRTHSSRSLNREPLVGKGRPQATTSRCQTRMFHFIQIRKAFIHRPKAQSVFGDNNLIIAELLPPEARPWQAIRFSSIVIITNEAHHPFQSVYHPTHQNYVIRLLSPPNRDRPQ